MGDDGRLQRSFERRTYDEIGRQSRFFGEVRGGGSGGSMIDGMIYVIVGNPYGASFAEMCIYHDGSNGEDVSY